VVAVPAGGIGEHPVEKHLLSAWSEPYRDRGIEIVAGDALRTIGFDIPKMPGFR
jgi:hypothetical protein